MNTSKFLFHYLSLLNIVDAILTYWGLEQSLISELNPIMNQIYQWSPALFIILKVFLSFCLYLFIILNIIPQTPLVKGDDDYCGFFLYTCFLSPLCLDCEVLFKDDVREVLIEIFLCQRQVYK